MSDRKHTESIRPARLLSRRSSGQASPKQNPAADRRSARVPVRQGLPLALCALALCSCGGDGDPAPETRAPRLSVATQVIRLQVGQEAEPVAIANTGGAIVSCTSEPSLPAGLAVDSRNCRISGTPTGKSPQIQTYNVIAKNAIGTHSVRINLHIDEARDQMPPPEPAQELTLELNHENPDPEPFSLPLGAEILITKTPIRAIPPNLQSGGILMTNISTVLIGTCTIEPNLPEGLSLVSNPYYCLVRGAPAVVSPRTTYTVTATEKLTQQPGQGGTATAGETPEPRTPQTAQVSFDIVVPNTTIPPRLVSAGDVRLFSGSRVNLPIVFDNIGEALRPVASTGGEMQNSEQTAQCAITPTRTGEAAAPNSANPGDRTVLPAGWIAELTSDGRSCQLNIGQSGTPAIVAAEDGTMPDSLSYRIRVAGVNRDGRASSAAVSVHVLNSTPPAVSQAPALATPAGIVLMHLAATAPIVLANSGGAAIACRIDRRNGRPDLPAGLELSVSGDAQAGTCVITGTPGDIERKERQYTVTASNAIGDSSATITLQVEPVPPAFDDKATVTEPMGVIVPEDGQLNLSVGAALAVNLANKGGPASYCRFISDPGSKVDFEHPDYTTTLTGGGTGCTVSGTAPSRTPSGQSITTTPLMQTLYVEIGNSYEQKSVYRLELVVSPPGQTPPQGLAQQTR